MGTNILDNSQLVRTGAKLGLTPDQVSWIISENDAARAVVMAFGGINEFIRLTDGGRLDPKLWPVVLPDWPPKPSTPVEPPPRVVGPPPDDPFVRKDVVGEAVLEILKLVQEIHAAVMPLRPRR